MSVSNDSRAVLLMTPLLLLWCAREPAEERRIDIGTRWKPAFYSSDKIEARVIDDSTGLQLQGVAVLAVWRNVDDLTHHWRGIFRFQETVTDEAGVFVIARWGPRPSPQFVHLDSRDPEIYLLKDGYRFQYLDNAGSREPLAPLGYVFPGEERDAMSSWMGMKAPPAVSGGDPESFVRQETGDSIWNGRTIKLRRVSSPQEQLQSLAAANPLDRSTLPSVTRMPAFWEAWHRIWIALPDDLKLRVHPDFAAFARSVAD